MTDMEELMTPIEKRELMELLRSRRQGQATSSQNLASLPRGDRKDVKITLSTSSTTCGCQGDADGCCFDCNYGI